MTERPERTDRREKGERKGRQDEHNVIFKGALQGAQSPSK